MSARSIIAAMLLGTSAISTPALAAGSQPAAVTPYMTLGEERDAPRGFLAMCAQTPALCDAGATAPADPAPLAAADWCSQAVAPVLLQVGLPMAMSGAGFTIAVAGTCQAPAVRPAAAARGTDAASLPSPSASPATVHLDLRQLTRINALVNDRVEQMTDAAGLGVDEIWRPSGIAPGAVGDCEDVAMEKRIQLMKAGYPAESLFLAVAYRRSQGLHVVLVARTDGGDFVLDNMTRKVRPWDKVPYSWLRIQAPGDPRRWFRLA